MFEFPKLKWYEWALVVAGIIILSWSAVEIISWAFSGIVDFLK